MELLWTYGLIKNPIQRTKIILKEGITYLNHRMLIIYQLKNMLTFQLKKKSIIIDQFIASNEPNPKKVQRFRIKNKK